MRTVLGLLLIICFACKGQKEINRLDEKPLEVGLELVLEDNYSGVHASKNLIIKDKETLQKFFSQINKMRKPGIPVPIIDFSKEVVVILCEGEHAATFSKELEVLKETDEIVKLHSVSFTKKNASKATITPFKLYKYNRTKKAIVFE